MQQHGLQYGSPRSWQSIAPPHALLDVQPPALPFSLAPPRDPHCPPCHTLPIWQPTASRTFHPIPPVPPSAQPNPPLLHPPRLPPYLLPAQRFPAQPDFHQDGPHVPVNDPPASSGPHLFQPRPSPPSAPPSSLQERNDALLHRIHNTVFGSGVTVTAESGFPFNPLNPASLYDPRTMSFDTRLQRLESVVHVPQPQSVRGYFTGAAELALVNPSLGDTPARAVANLHLDRATRAENLVLMSDFGGAGVAAEPLMVKELMFKHSLGSPDPMMRAAEDVGSRLLREERRRMHAALGLSSLGVAKRLRPSVASGRGGGAFGDSDVPPVPGPPAGGGIVLGGGRSDPGLGEGAKRGRSVPPEERHCHWCKGLGHLVAECPAKASGAPKADGPTPNWLNRRGHGPGGRGPRLLKKNSLKH